MTTVRNQLRSAHNVAANINKLLESRGQKIEWYSSIDRNGDFLRKRFNESKDEVLVFAKKNEINPLIALSSLTEDQKTLVLAVYSDSKAFLLTKSIKNAKTLGIHFGVDNVIMVVINNKRPSKLNMRLFYDANERPLLEYFTFEELLIDPLSNVFCGKAELVKGFVEEHPHLFLRDKLGRLTSNDLLRMRVSDPVSRRIGAVRGDIVQIESKILLPGIEHASELMYYIVH